MEAGLIFDRLDLRGDQPRRLSPPAWPHAVMWFAEEASRDTRYDHRYAAKELNEIMDTVEILAWRARDTYVIINNPQQGADRQA